MCFSFGHRISAEAELRSAMEARHREAPVRCNGANYECECCSEDDDGGDSQGARCFLDGTDEYHASLGIGKEDLSCELLRIARVPGPGRRRRSSSSFSLVVTQDPKLASKLRKLNLKQ